METGPRPRAGLGGGAGGGRGTADGALVKGQAMDIAFYQVDAFTGHVFGGNPAGVCLLEDWLSEATMQAVAEENNLPETAFVVRDGDDFGIRWFTPKVEIDLAGHPTLATAHVILGEVEPARRAVRFNTKLGDRIEVVRDHGRLMMDFPARPPAPRNLGDVAGALGAEPREVLAARDGFAVFDNQAQVAAIEPDMARLAAIDVLGVICTAPGDDCDFVSRFFAPGAGVPEDPVTGSAHCTLIPYWAERLGKQEMFARQISWRGGEIHCRHRGDRVGIGGEAAVYLRGTITL